MKHPFSLAALAALVLAGATFAAITDFRIPDGAKFNIGGTPSRLAVTPDDRFVLILDETNQAVKILDTWNFSLVNGSISLSDKPVAIALTPEGDKAYITLTNKKIAVLDLTSLADLGLNGTLSITPSDLGLTFSGALSDIATVPLGGSTTDSCVFVIDGGLLRWFKESSPSSTFAEITPLNCLATELEGGGGKYVYLLCDNSAGGNDGLHQIKCSSTGAAVTPNFSLDLGAVNSQGLSLGPDGEWLLLGDTTAANESLQLFSADTITPAINPEATLAIKTPFSEVLAADFAVDNPMAFMVSNNDLILALMNSVPSSFTGDTLNLALPVAGGGYLARSSAADQHVYLSLAGGETVAVVTANPWVEILDFDLLQGDTASTGTLTIKFTADWIGTGTGSYAIKLASGFKTGTALTGGSGTMASGDTVTKTLSVTGLSEGQNVISVEVAAGGRTGRDAVAITGGCGATPVNFSLDFGTGKIIVKFKALNCASVEKYEIYYGLGGTCEASAQDYDAIDDTGGDGEPASPIEITAPDPGEEIKEVVEGLEDGETYRVQVVSYDVSGGLGISARKCVLVERVLSLTDLADEDGGFDCFGIHPRGTALGSGVWMLGLPAAVWGMIRLGRRWRRRR